MAKLRPGQGSVYDKLYSLALLLCEVSPCSILKYVSLYTPAAEKISRLPDATLFSHRATLSLEISSKPCMKTVSLPSRVRSFLLATICLISYSEIPFVNFQLFSRCLYSRALSSDLSSVLEDWKEGCHLAINP